MCLRLHARGRCGWRRTLVPGRRSSRRGGTAGARSFSQNRARQGNYKARRDRRILRPSRSSSVPPISPQAAIATVASAYALSPFTLPAFSTLTVADFGWAIVLAFAETKTSCRSRASWPAGSRAYVTMDTPGGHARQSEGAAAADRGARLVQDPPTNLKPRTPNRFDSTASGDPLWRQRQVTTWCAISAGACWPGGLAGGYRSAARSETRQATAR